jgi:hypothetical protein
VETVTLTRRKAPYADTKVPAEQTRAEIDRLLRSYGVQDFQWTELWSRGVVQLRFAIEVEPQTQGRPARFVQIRVTPPSFTAKRKSWDPKRGYTTIESPNWPQAMRCLLHWLKAKLESVAFGLKSIEDEFLADMVVRGPDGAEHTVAELVRPALASGVLDIPALAGGDPPAHPERSVHEATYREAE